MPYSVAAPPTERARCKQPPSDDHRQLFRANELEAHGAFELPCGFAARLRVVLALPRFAQIARRKQRAGAIVDLLMAALLDKNAPDRRLAVYRREILAVPVVASKPRIEKVAEKVGLVAALRRVAARIAHDADTPHDSVGIDQRGHDDRETVGLGAGILLHLRGEIVGLGPIFELIVIAEIDLAQSARLRPATAEFAPPAKRQSGRPAIGAAGVINEFVRQLLDMGAQ